MAETIVVQIRSNSHPCSVDLFFSEQTILRVRVKANYEKLWIHALNLGI